MDTPACNRSANGRARRQRGFTLVELITVILILGVLAAVALPRYADLQGKARVAKVNAIVGSMKAAASLVKATAMATAQSCSTATGLSVTMEGTTVLLNYCYPEANPLFTAGILAAANVSAADNWAVDGTIAGGTSGGSAMLVKLSDAATPANCSVTYTAPSSANSGPTVTSVTTGC